MYLIMRRSSEEFLAGSRAVKAKVGKDYVAPNWTVKKSAAQAFTSKVEAESKIHEIFGNFAPTMFDSLRLVKKEVRK
jgi:hypothetical protein